MKNYSALFFAFATRYRLRRIAIAHALLLFLLPQYSIAYSYLALGNTGELEEVSSSNPLFQAEPIVWSQNRISLAIDLEGVDAPPNSGISVDNNGWNTAALISMEKWNEAALGFSWERDSITNSGDLCGFGVSEDGVNQIAWSSDYCGAGWGSGTLALTQITYQITEGSGGTRDEIIDIQILVNSSHRWDVYDGPLQYASQNTPTYDLKRVLLHELGHGLGPTHPDDNGQNVSSIMLSTESDTFNLTSDDIEGVNTLYPESASGVLSPIGRSSGGGGFNLFLSFYILIVFVFRRLSVS